MTTKQRLYGFGCPEGWGATGDEVCYMLSKGSPRFALVKALGVPTFPWVFNVRAVFVTTDAQAVIPDQGADAEIVQDCFVDEMRSIVTIDRTPAGAFDTQFDYFFMFSNTIEAKLQVTGNPRPSIAPEFTPLSTLTQVGSMSSKWPYGFILTQGEGVKMDFTTRVALPDAPVTVVCTFRVWQPVIDVLVNVSNEEAVQRLRAMGFDVPEPYISYLR